MSEMSIHFLHPVRSTRTSGEVGFGRQAKVLKSLKLMKFSTQVLLELLKLAKQVKPLNLCHEMGEPSEISEPSETSEPREIIQPSE